MFGSATATKAPGNQGTALRKVGTLTGRKVLAAAQACEQESRTEHQIPPRPAQSGPLIDIWGSTGQSATGRCPGPPTPARMASEDWTRPPCKGVMADPAGPIKLNIARRWGGYIRYVPSLTGKKFHSASTASEFLGCDPRYYQFPLTTAAQSQRRDFNWFLVFYHPTRAARKDVSFSSPGSQGPMPQVDHYTTGSTSSLNPGLHQPRPSLQRCLVCAP